MAGRLNEGVHALLKGLCCILNVLFGEQWKKKGERRGKEGGENMGKTGEDWAP